MSCVAKTLNVEVADVYKANTEQAAKNLPNDDISTKLIAQNLELYGYSVSNRCITHNQGLTPKLALKLLEERRIINKFILLAPKAARKLIESNDVDFMSFLESNHPKDCLCPACDDSLYVESDDE